MCNLKERNFALSRNLEMVHAVVSRVLNRYHEHLTIDRKEKNVAKMDFRIVLTGSSRRILPIGIFWTVVLQQIFHKN